MSNNQPTTEEKKLLLHVGVSAGLVPTLPNGVRIALSEKQNFALGAEEIFCHALNRTVWQYREDYAAVELFFSVIRNTAMESVATEKGIERIAEVVFGNSAMREFIATLRIQFYSQFAEFHTHWEDLIAKIAIGLTAGEMSSNAKPELSLVPEDVRIRTFDAEQMKDILLANSWLIMFLLTALWGRSFSYAELRSNYKQNYPATIS